MYGTPNGPMRRPSPNPCRSAGVTLAPLRSPGVNCTWAMRRGPSESRAALIKCWPPRGKSSRSLGPRLERAAAQGGIQGSGSRRQHLLHLPPSAAASPLLPQLSSALFLPNLPFILSTPLDPFIFPILLLFLLHPQLSSSSSVTSLLIYQFICIPILNVKFVKF